MLKLPTPLTCGIGVPCALFVDSMNSVVWFLGSMIALGAIHTGLLLYLKFTGARPSLYSELKVNKFLIFSMVLTGSLIGFLLSTNYSAEEYFRRTSVILGFAMSVPLFIFGVGSLNVIVRLLLAKFR